jgi:hypothetical protein
MSLLGNGYRHSSTGRLFGATLLDGANPTVLEGQRHLTARMRNMFISEAFPSPLMSVPNGKRPPYVWVMAKEGGGMSSFQRASIELDAAVVGELGFPRVAVGSLSLDAFAVGGLIAGLTATAAATFSATAAAEGIVNGTATFSATLDGSVVAGAIAGMTATGAAEFDGAVDIYGIGFFTASTENDEVGLTPANVGAAVWGALAAANNGVGTMGEKLNDAGSASNPWTEVIESGFTAAEILRLLAAVAAGKTAVVNLGGGAATITFRDLADTKDRVTASMTGSERTAITRNVT